MLLSERALERVMSQLSNVLFPVCFRQLFDEVGNFENFQILQKIQILSKKLTFLHKKDIFKPKDIKGLEMVMKTEFYLLKYCSFSSIYNI